MSAVVPADVVADIVSFAQELNTLLAESDVVIREPFEFGAELKSQEIAIGFDPVDGFGLVVSE